MCKTKRKLLFIKAWTEIYIITVKQFVDSPQELDSFICELRTLHI